jgi:hypothetical protein
MEFAAIKFPAHGIRGKQVPRSSDVSAAVAAARRPGFRGVAD